MIDLILFYRIPRCKSTIFLNVLVECVIFLLFLPHNFEANHNKDYSVVKTSKGGASNCSRFFFLLQNELLFLLCRCV